MKKVTLVPPSYRDLLSHQYGRRLWWLTNQMSKAQIFPLPSHRSKATNCLIPTHRLRYLSYLPLFLLPFEWWTGCLSCCMRQPDGSKVTEQNNPFMKSSSPADAKLRGARKVSVYALSVRSISQRMYCSIHSHTLRSTQQAYHPGIGCAAWMQQKKKARWMFERGLERERLTCFTLISFSLNLFLFPLNWSLSPV